MVVAFELDGQPFTALNGGPQFKFDEAISFQVMCDTQDEIDYYWNALTEGGQEGPCGWLKDKFGLSWQVVPSAIPKMMTDPDASEVRARHERLHENEEARYRGDRARLCRAGGMNAAHAIRRRHRRHHPRIRRAARAGVAGLDRSEDVGAMVRPARLHQFGAANWTCASAAPCASSCTGRTATTIR